MAQFWCPASRWREGQASLDESESRHAAAVMRLRVGEPMRIFDGEGRAAIGVIAALSPLVQIQNLRLLDPVVSSSCRLRVGVALLPNEAMQEAVAGLTEYGCERISPMRAERSGIRLDRDKAAAKIDQWRRVALTVCKQSHRRVLPAIDPIVDLNDLIHEEFGVDSLRWIASPAGNAPLLREALRSITPSSARPVQITALIGPEGGWSEAELANAVLAGWFPVSLGEEVLRAESAAAFVAATVKALLR